MLQGACANRFLAPSAERKGEFIKITPERGGEKKCATEVEIYFFEERVRVSEKGKCGGRCVLPP